MRRLFFIIFLLFASFVASPAVLKAQTPSGLQLCIQGQFSEYTGDIYYVQLDGTVLQPDTPCIGYNGRIMVPVRAVFEKYGAEVTWIPETQTASIKMTGVIIELTVDSIDARVNGEIRKMDVPVIGMNNRIYIPVRFASEWLNMKVEWIPESKTAAIDRNSVDNILLLDTQDAWEIHVVTKGKSSFRSFALKEPDRIVLDIPNVLVSSKTITNQSGSVITGIRSASFQGAARIVVDLSFVRQFTAAADGDGIVIRILKQASDIPEPQLPQMVYTKKSGVTAVLRLTGLEFVPLPAETSEGNASGTETASETASGSASDTGTHADTDTGNRIWFTMKKDLTGTIHTFYFAGDILASQNPILEPKDGLLSQISCVFYPEYAMTYLEIVTVSPLAVTATVDSVLGEVTINMGKTRLVVINPGHGGADPGAVYFGLKEKDFNLDIALRLDAILKQQGVSAILTRYDDRDLDLYERTRMANELDACLYLSIHNNAASAGATGTETFFQNGKNNTGPLTSQEFAQLVQNNIIAATGLYNRGAKNESILYNGAGLAELRTTHMIAALTEVCFLSNADDAAKLQDAGFRQKVAEALAKAIVTALERI